MSLPLIAALLFTVALLVTTAYFILGSVPLLILQHDTPKDSRFVRGFFNTYYLAAVFAASGAAVSFAFARRPLIAAGAAMLVVVALVLRWKITAKMDELGTRIQSGATDAIAGFRRAHVSAILINLAQLVLILWSLTVFTTQ